MRRTESYRPAPISAVGASGGGQMYWVIGFGFLLGGVFFAQATAILAACFWAQNRNEPNRLKRENARGAANWIMTTMIAQTVLVAPAIALVIDLLVNGREREVTVLVFPLIGLYLLVGFVHLVVITIGTFVSRTRIFRPPLALPFFGVTREV